MAARGSARSRSGSMHNRLLVYDARRASTMSIMIVLFDLIKVTAIIIIIIILL